MKVNTNIRHCIISVIMRFIFSHFLFFLVAQCTDGTLDIINQVNANVKDNGQLFICLDDTWFPLCSNDFDDDEAQAACRQLGFVDGSKL